LGWTNFLLIADSDSSVAEIMTFIARRADIASFASNWHYHSFKIDMKSRRIVECLEKISRTASENKSGWPTLGEFT
jgi:hypothetical protein